MFLAKKLNKGAGTPIVPADAQFNYVTMLLHGDGTNGAQNNTFLDSSASPLTITRNGNTTQGSFSPYGSNWSNYFNDGTYLSIPNNAVFNPGSGDFTVEAMFCRTVNTGGSQTIIAKYETSWQASYSIVIANNNWDVYITYGVGSYALVYSGAAPAVGVWSHVALQRSGSYWEFYCNGVRLAQVTAYTIASTTSAIRIGELGAGYSGYSFNGHISNVRIRNGYATYSGSTYTVPTANLTAITGTVLLTCQSNRFIDNSSNNFTITAGTVGTGAPSVQRFNPFGTSTAYSTSVIGGSAYFDGTGDYLNVASNAALGLSTGDFTIDAWVYTPSFSAIQAIIDLRTGAVAEPSALSISATGLARSYDTTVRTGGQLNANQWNHIAWVRASSVNTVYVNGVVGHTWTNGGDFGSSRPAWIGASAGGASERLTGYISNLRVVKGTAVYTAAFTPPTAPLTAITNTSLLTNFTNGAIFDNAMINNLETLGNAQISTSVKKFNTGSLAFDGTGDYLTTPFSALYQFGTGDFTIEFWIYRSAGSVYQAILDTRSSGIATPWAVLLNSSNQPYILIASDLTSSIAVPATTWTHIAICRASGTLRIFNDGVQGYSAANTTSMSPTGALRIGKTVDNLYDLNGYIDDLRITKGYARYTSNFTPPTAAFPNNN